MDNQSLATKPKLIYIPDALCSHSYGFEPQVRKIRNHFGDRIDFELVNGGLRPYGTKKILESASFLRGQWQEIQEYSGQPFSYQLLESETYIVDSEPPARAVVTVREMAPDKEFIFFLDVQRMVFAESKDSNKVESYYELLGKFGLNRERFTALFNSAAMKARAKSDFELTASLGVNGFPTILLEINGKIYQISRGYSKADTVIAEIEQIIRTQKK